MQRPRVNHIWVFMPLKCKGQLGVRHVMSLLRKTQHNWQSGYNTARREKRGKDSKTLRKETREGKAPHQCLPILYNPGPVKMGILKNSVSFTCFTFLPNTYHHLQSQPS